MFQVCLNGIQETIIGSYKGMYFLIGKLYLWRLNLKKTSLCEVTIGFNKIAFTYDLVF